MINELIKPSYNDVNPVQTLFHIETLIKLNLKVETSCLYVMLLFLHLKNGVQVFEIQLNLE